MNNDIKEIINRLKKENLYMNSRRIILCESEISTLLDYITNLQEELFNEKQKFNDYLTKQLDKKIENGAIKYDSELR